MKVKTENGTFKVTSYKPSSLGLDTCTCCHDMLETKAFDVLGWLYCSFMCIHETHDNNI